MRDIDYILGSKKYLNAVDPVTATIESVGKVAEAGGKVAQSIQKPDLGKLIAQRCGRKGFGYVFSKRKREEFGKCADSVTANWNKQYDVQIQQNASQDATKSLIEQTSKTNTILLGTIGIGVLGLLGYLVVKK
jgi:hypothetical protein